jgi:GST-like protein
VAILIYLAEKCGRFLPTDLSPRVRTLEWLMIQTSSVGPMLGQANHFHRVAPQGQVYATERYLSQARHLFGVLDGRLAEARFLGGDDYSIADMATFPWIRWAMNDAPWREDPPLGDRHQHLGRWVAAVGTRPAVVRGIEALSDVKADAAAAKSSARPEAMDRFFLRGGLAF